MRLSLSLLIIGTYVVGPIAPAQTASSQTAASQPAASQPAVGQPDANQPAVSQPAGVQHTAHPSRHPDHSSPRHPAHPGTANAAAGRGDGVLNLGATDITGNKELPKVMVIVPWKGSLGADGVIKPTDSLMDEVLAPVDRSVFQRQVRYYGQLSGGRAAKRGATAQDARAGGPAARDGQ